MKQTQKQTTKGSEQARQQLPALLAAAEQGRTTVITKHGRAVAAIVPATNIKLQTSLLALAGTGRGMWGRNSSAAVNKLRDEWNR
jgi:prevent-host-death family protein